MPDPSRPSIVVEKTDRGSWIVSIHPLRSRPELERAFHFESRAFEYADQLADRFGWRLIDQTKRAL